ncbi:hypothetical protein ISS03_05395 [Patescibacteria group bacterium]|nr:hypothetical protein [Patescibacteria group bacterium]
MYIIRGTIKGERTKKYKRKDGSDGIDRKVFIDPEGSIYPVAISLRDHTLDIGEKGDEVELQVRVYPYALIEGDDGKKKRVPAEVDIYIPRERTE